jgi:hypothetical protein
MVLSESFGGLHTAIAVYDLLQNAVKKQRRVRKRKSSRGNEPHSQLLIQLYMRGFGLRSPFLAFLGVLVDANGWYETFDPEP